MVESILKQDRFSAWVRFPLGFACFLAASCGSGPNEIAHEIRGEVVSIYSERNEITLKHEEIVGFMPAMTMPISVMDVRILVGIVPGDLVVGTLVVTDTESYLSTLEKVGSSNPESPISHTPSGVRLVRTGESAPAVALVDQEAQARNLSDLTGRPFALTFIYTRCPLPEYCPLMDRNFVAVQSAILQGERLSRDTKLLSISFDPDHDTPEILKSHAAKLGADSKIWSFLTGEREQILHLGEQFGITVVRDSADSLDITHSLRTVVVDREGRVAKIIRGNTWTPDSLIDILRQAGSEGIQETSP